MSFLYDDSEEPFEALKIPQEELFRLIPIWEKLMKEKPEEIILVRDNGKFNLIGKSVSKEIMHEDAEC